MTKYISIDPGKYKCGLIFADFKNKKILKAIIIESNLLVQNISKLRELNDSIKVLIGNGTTSKEHYNSLSFLKEDLTIVEEKNTTFRAKERYFESYPIRGFRRLVPRELFLKNINLDAISALLILEDYLNFKFTLNNEHKSKTWRKS